MFTQQNLRIFATHCCQIHDLPRGGHATFQCGAGPRVGITRAQNGGYYVDGIMQGNFNGACQAYADLVGVQLEPKPIINPIRYGNHSEPTMPGAAVRFAAMLNPTHPLDMHPLLQMTGALVRWTLVTEAGYDCVVAVPLAAAVEAWAACYATDPQTVLHDWADMGLVFGDVVHVPAHHSELQLL